MRGPRHRGPKCKCGMPALALSLQSVQARAHGTNKHGTSQGRGTMLSTLPSTGDQLSTPGDPQGKWAPLSPPPSTGKPPGEVDPLSTLPSTGEPPGEVGPLSTPLSSVEPPGEVGPPYTSLSTGEPPEGKWVTLSTPPSTGRQGDRLEAVLAEAVGTRYKMSPAAHPDVPGLKSGI